jgi:hypothetical protein
MRNKEGQSDANKLSTRQERARPGKNNATAQVRESIGTATRLSLMNYGGRFLKTVSQSRDTNSA